MVRCHAVPLVGQVVLQNIDENVVQVCTGETYRQPREVCTVCRFKRFIEAAFRLYRISFLELWTCLKIKTRVVTFPKKDKQHLNFLSTDENWKAVSMFARPILLGNFRRKSCFFIPYSVACTFVVNKNSSGKE